MYTNTIYDQGLKSKIYKEHSEFKKKITQLKVHKRSEQLKKIYTGKISTKNKSST